MDDERFMARALELARAAPFCSPNPRVAAVAVVDGVVVAEAVHRGPGTAHAEQALAATGADLRSSTVYVNLEPCIHHGRTPPCAPVLVEAGVARVVAAIHDPDPRVRGAGADHLRAHGIDVTVGPLAEDAAAVNEAYVHQRTTGRPLVTLKLALTLDGRLAAPDGSSAWITGPPARRLVHRRRAGVDAVMVGAGTVVADDPLLTARDVDAERQPVRVVVDASGVVAPAARALAGGEVIVATTEAAPHEVQIAWKEAGVEVVVLPGAPGRVDLAAMLDRLAERGWLEILCEGGARLATSLLRDDLVDRLEVHLGPVLVGRGGPEIGDLGVASIASARRFAPVAVARVGDDVVASYRRAGSG